MRTLIATALAAAAIAPAAIADPVPTNSAAAAAAPATTPEAAPADPVPKPVNEAEALQPKPEESQAVTLGKQLFVALAENGNVGEIAALLRDSVNSLGGICPNVTHYQVYRQTISVLTLKVACSNRPLYLLSVDTDGGMLADGGDGQVEPMDTADGTISAAPAAGGSSAPTASGGAVDPAAAPSGGSISSAPIGDTVGGSTPQGWMRWLFAVIALIVAFLAYAIYRRFTRQAMVTAGPMTRLDRRYSSADKDKMIEESEALTDNMWRHSSGLYIVRGRHGKRRLFPSWTFAQIYHLWGIKIRQIR